MNLYNAIATCAFGLESVLSFELKRLGINEQKTSDGRIEFRASERDIVRANLWLRTAERVLIELARYEAATFDQLFDGAYAVEWENYIPRDGAFPVKGYSIGSTLTSVPACQSVMKKALVKRLQSGHGTQFLTERGAKTRVQFSLVKDICTIMLDTTGDGLHKRGYRPLSTEAPIKETLAAGIVDFARVRQDSAVYDPFCGSGTLVIEAAMKARNIAPGLKRQFAFNDYSFFDKSVFAEELKNAKAAQIDCAFRGRGSDLDERSLESARRNAAAAGVGDCCEFFVADARTAEYKEDEIVLANPPYGERIMDERELEALYTSFCGNLRAQPHKSFYMITNYPLLERDMGRSADRRRKLYNGMIQCQLYMYY